jgi:polar amino acid transport system substrate-binding protein
MAFSPVSNRKIPTFLQLGGALTAITLMATGCAGNAAGTAAPAADCKPVADVKTLTPGKLKVLEVEHPPFVTTGGNNLTGVEGELVKKIASDLCLQLDIQVTSFAGAIEGLQNNRGDLSSANWSVNDERRKLFEVSNPMYRNGMAVVTKGQGWDTADSLKGKKIGTPQGYLWNAQIKAIYGDNVIEYQSDTAVVDDVKAGRIDAGLVNIHANSWRLTQPQYKELTLKAMQKSPELPHTQNPPLAVVLVKKGSTDLRDAVNTTLKKYKDSGEMKNQFEKYGLDPEFIVSGNS